MLLPRMHSLIIALLGALWLSWTETQLFAAPNPQPSVRIPMQIQNLTHRHAYFAKGTKQGVKVGTSIRFKKGVRCEVDQVSQAHSRCQSASLKRLSPGQKGWALVAKVSKVVHTRKALTSITPQQKRKFKQKLKLNTVKKVEHKQAGRWRLHIQQRRRQRFSNDTAWQSGQLRLWAEHPLLGLQQLRTQIDAQLWWNQTSPTDFRSDAADDLRLLIWNANLQWHTPQSIVGLGRFSMASSAGLLSLDGVRIEWNPHQSRLLNMQKMTLYAGQQTPFGLLPGSDEHRRFSGGWVVGHRMQWGHRLYHPWSFDIHTALQNRQGSLGSEQSESSQLGWFFTPTLRYAKPSIQATAYTSLRNLKLDFGSAQLQHASAQVAWRQHRLRLIASGSYQHRLDEFALGWLPNTLDPNRRIRTYVQGTWIQNRFEIGIRNDAVALLDTEQQRVGLGPHITMKWGRRWIRLQYTENFGWIAGRRISLSHRHTTQRWQQHYELQVQQIALNADQISQPLNEITFYHRSQVRVRKNLRLSAQLMFKAGFNDPRFQTFEINNDRLGIDAYLGLERLF